jgi:hypothetical protein
MGKEPATSQGRGGVETEALTAIEADGCPPAAGGPETPAAPPDVPRFPFDPRARPGKREPAVESLAERLEEAIGEEAHGRHPHILRPLAALSEVDAVSRSIDQGHAPANVADRRSLTNDLHLAFSTLGAETRRLLQPAHFELIDELVPRLPELLEDPAGRLHLSGIVHELRRRLVSADGVVAAWRDLRQAAASGQYDDDELPVFGSRVAEIVEAFGLEWRWTRQDVVQYIRRGLFDEVEDELRRPVERSAHAAWFVFGYADLPSAYLRVGQVQFFSSRLWPDTVRDQEAIERFPEAEYPSELTDDALEHRVSVDASLAPEHLVYARVELQGARATGDRNPWAHRTPPMVWARDYVQAIVQAATFRQGGSTWQLLDGAAMYHDNDGWSGSWPFHDPRKFDPKRDARNPLHEGTGDALEALPVRFAERLSEGAPDARAAAREVQWHLAVARQADPAQRIALFVRGFELSLPIIGDERWHGAAHRYFRDFWALNDLGDDVFRCANDTERAFNWTGHSEELKDIPPFTEHDGRRVVVDLQAFVDAAPTLLERIPAHRREERRRLRGVVRWSADPHAAFADIDRRRQQFDILLKRATRQRNAVVHGVETVPAVIATAEPFVASLAATIAATHVEEAGTGGSTHHALERGRMIASRRLWRLNNESPAVVSSILFGEA